MRIGRLELFGFKSFPDRTRFHFGGGISCVVGPNGSGKSNVVDALKWCVGEQSAKSLRGGDMQDVIFAGSTDRSPVGFAEVRLTLASDKGEPFPGEYSQLEELEVGRRLHRNGTSEYLINQNRVRRRDVMELFMDTGIGANLYSFIEQGQVDKMVRASPAERRLIVDEAAGIAKYKARRDQARSRLEATAAQLDRASDVEDEMARRLRSLERQVVKAAKFRRLSALVRQDELDLSLVRYDELAGDRRALREAHRELSGTLASTRLELARREADLENRRGALEISEAEVGRLRDDLADVDGRRREVDATRRLQSERAAELRRSADDAASEAERAEARLAEAGAELAAATVAAEDAERAAAAATVELSEGRAELKAAELEHGARSAEAASHLSAQAAAVAEADRSKLALASLEQQRAGVPAERERAEREQAAWEGRLDELQRAIDVERGDTARARAAGSDALAVSRVLDLRVAETQERVVAAEEGRRVVESELASLDAEDIGADPAFRAASAKLLVAERSLEAARADRDAKLESQQRSRRRRVDVAWQRVRRDEAEAARRLELWRAAVLEWQAARLRAVEGQYAHRSEQEDSASQTEITALDEEQRASIEAAEMDARALGDARLADLEFDRAKLEHELGEAAEATRLARREVARIEASLEAAEARVAASEREALAARASRSGALAACDTVLSLVESSGDDMVALAGILGSRLALPVCTPAELAAAAKGGSAIDAIVRRPGPMDLRRQLNAVTEARGIDAALAELQSGAPAVIDVVTGVRIEADGRATLPRLEDAGRQAADRVARARDAAAEVEALTLDLPVAQDALVGAGAQVQQIESALGVLRQRAAQAMATTSAAVETARTAARAAGLPRIEQARVRLQQRRETWRAERQAAVQELKRLEAAESAQAQASAVNVLERVRAEADAAARAVEDEERLATAIVVEAVDAALEAAEQGVAAERERAREAREAAHQNRESGRQALADRLAAVREVVEGARAAAEAARVEAGEGRAAKVEAEATLAAAVRAEATTDAEIARCHLQLADARSLLEQSELRAAKLTSQCEQATGRVEAAALVLEDATRTAGRADSAVALGRGVLEDARSRATRSEVAMATAEERLRAARQSLEAARSRRSDAAAVLTDISSRRGALHESEVSALAAMESAVVELAGLDETRATVWDRYQVARERQSRGREGLAQAEMDAGQLRVRERDLAGRSEDAKGELERVQTEIEVLRRRAEERYQAVLPAMLDRLHARGSIGLGVSDEALLGVAVGGQRIEGVAPRDLSATQLMDRMRVQEVAARLEDNRAQLARLGEVNLGALDEHVDLARRHTELVSQREDLEASIRTIRAAIAKMNRTCRQRFRDAFDRINSNFQESYPRLVGGGAARLSLTNEEDLLETGVDIFVQPPGKRLQNLSLLSGGEKAMTAIALLIAVFQVKPSPFCVLDEVDAPLDEANGARFNEMLKDLSRITQFVVVTHNRKTMECADTLYGVTMARPGVSRLVAVDL